jgi:hypothetical protein
MNHFRNIRADRLERGSTLSSRQKRRSLEATIRRNPGVGLVLLVEEITRVLVPKRMAAPDSFPEIRRPLIFPELEVSA